MIREPSRRLDKRAIKVWRISSGFHTALVAIVPIVLFILTWQVGLPWIYPVLAFVFTCIYGLFFIKFYPELRWRRWRYEIYEHEIDLLHGIFFIKRTVIPMVRIQHVDTLQGPLLRKFELSTVTFSTAALRHEIPALASETADHVRVRIAELAEKSKEDV